ncbi:N-acyl amino acid synthase FeeM domain-containing protein [Sessilibacter corallicola]|uniref:N-acyl amino acid synthase FeeM domain-containing protein n=1 Tax=Sessilibacter corallicola TaxID=2904075 RepID=UPI001E5D32D8|nr:hypothetical protein [Sessilibacter corallicola]MCE2030344.1 hypothetical protein [Sessilibacter corallicola]
MTASLKEKVDEQEYEATHFSVQLIDRNDYDRLNRVGQLWQQVYDHERGLIECQGNKDDLIDEFHASSDYICASDVNYPNEIVATVRVVKDSCNGLPIEKFFPLTAIKSDANLIEPHRLIVLPEYRKIRYPGAPYGLFGLLFKFVVQHYMIFDGKSLIIDAFTDTKESPVSAFRGMGASEFGIPFMDTELQSATKSIAMYCSIRDVLKASLNHRGNKFAQYLLNKQ